MSVALPRDRPPQAPPQAPPHAPEGGWSRRLLGPFHVTGVFWFRFHRFGVTILPEPALRVVIAFFAAFFWLALRQIRAAVASNLEAVLWPRRRGARQRPTPPLALLLRCGPSA